MISMSGETKSIPDVMSGFSQKIDDTHYLIGTNFEGVYQVIIDKDGVVTKAEQYCAKSNL